MRRKTGRMIAAGAAVFCAAAGVLCGCQSEQIEYDTQGTPPEEVSHITVEKQRWETKVVPSYGNGEEDSIISIDVNIKPPSTDELYVVEFEKLEFDEDYKKQILKTFLAAMRFTIMTKSTPPGSGWNSWLPGSRRPLPRHRVYLPNTLTYRLS